MSHGDRELVAIIGVGCKFPGADNLEEFWSLLENGENHVTEIPETRWFHESVYDPDFNTPAKTHARKAGLLKDHLAFDNKLFNIKDVEADIMDPQQRYVLECCHRALEDAGLTKDQLRGSNTCVFIGAMNTDYRSQFNITSFVPDNYAVTGMANSTIANRVSYIYDLRGSSVTIDTACSSSLVAIDMGLHYLRAGVCDMVVCGGVNSILTAEVFIHLSKARLVSAKGQCFTFSDQVDGYTRGEGCGVVILKRLHDPIRGHKLFQQIKCSVVVKQKCLIVGDQFLRQASYEAKRDKNKIWATIETGCNQDGGTVAPISKPSEEQQRKLLQAVWDRSRVDPGDLVYIEAHGTGTPVGDVAEINALGKFLQGTHTGNTRYIGSVKTNIGHLESAAGVSGLIKVLLMMKHSKIVPSLHFQRPNPNIDFDGFHLKVATEVISWPELHKVASVTSCGFGGTNCYAIIESQGQPGRAKPDMTSENIVCFSAMNLESLKGSMKDFVNYPDVLSMNIEDLALTSTIHRDHFPVRQAFVANTTESLLRHVVKQMARIKYDSSDAKNPKIVFVFSGMGTAWPSMARAYMSTSQVFRDKIRDIDTCLREYVPWSVEDRLGTELDTRDEMFWPIAIFACQIATAHLWVSLGVTPDCVVGYSMGEVAAAHVAGRLSLSEAVKVIYHRTTMLARLAGVGRMILFKDVDIETVEEIVNNWQGKANVSTKISPKACAVSGETDVISEIEKQVNDMAKSQNMTIQTIDLKLRVAYHSHCVDGCKEELRQVLNGTGLCQLDTQTEMISTVTGDVVDGPLTAEHWVNNVREPVLFLDAVRKSFAEDANTVYIEVGTKPVMAAHKDDIFPGQNAKVVVSMRAKADWKTFLEALGQAYRHGCSVNWKNLPQTGQVITAVPRYSFTPRRLLRSSETTSMAMAGIDFIRRQHPFVCKIESTDMFRVFLSAASFKSVFDHTVSGNLIIPGALYAEIAFAIGKMMQIRQAALYSVSATFEQPCRFSDKQPVIFNLDISSKPQAGPSGSHLKSYTVAVMQHETLYATLHLHPFTAPRDHSAVNIEQVKFRCPQIFARRDIYKKLASFGFNYGPHYMLLEKARRNTDECIAYMTVPGTLFDEMPGTTVHPSVLDAMMQTFVILTGDNGDKKEVLPISIGKLTSFRTLENEMYVHTIVKDSYGKMFICDSKLTTLDGEIIVEMEDFTLKLLSAESNTNGDNTEHIYRCHWVMKVPDYPYIKQTDPQILYMSNELTPPDVTSIEYSIDEDCSDTITQQLDILKRNHALETFRCIVFNISFMFADSVEASILQSKIVNLFMVLKSVFCFTLKIPVYVFTRWAVSAEWSSSNKDNINPLMTAVWGMVRSALQEQIADICVLDLHLAQEQCSLDRLTSLANFVHKNNDLKRFPEWMITENKMFVNEIIPLANNIVPAFKHISADRHHHVLQVSNGPLGSTDTFCVYDESHKLVEKTDHLQISVTESIVFHPHLFSRSIPYSSMVPHKCHLGSGNVVFALETTGTQAHTSVQGCQPEVIACYPSPIGSQISVPAAATLPKDLFDCYSHGDVTRLSVLMALSSYIHGSSVTILTSASTRGLCQILCEMLVYKDRSPPTINITCMSPEELQNGQRLNRTVVSLVLLDSSLISVLMNHWPQAECLVTAAPLVSSRVKSLVNFHLPSVELIVMDPSEALQPMKLLGLVHDVKEFSSSHRCLVSKCLAGQNTLTERFSEVTADLSDLLKIQTVKVNRSRVRVDHHLLFKKDAVYVVVGGLTGLGWITVRFLSSQGAGNIAILNRREPGVDRRRQINELSQSTACNIQWFGCDVCNKDSFSNFLNVTAATAFPNKLLKGIFFGAAVEGDAILSKVTREHLEHVMSPKVLGAWNAHILTEDRDLDYFVLQSSVTSVIGNFGQTSYGAANAFLDGLACYRRHRNLPGQSIIWGPLTVGMMADNEKAKQGLSQKGMQLLTEAEVQAVMNPILLLDFGQVIACNFDREKWRKNPLITMHGSISFEIPLTENLRRALQTAPHRPREERIQVYVELLVVLTSQIIGIDRSLLQPDSALLALGMDSLLAMTVRNEVFKVTQCRLPAVVLVSGDVTARILAETLDAEIQREVQGRLM